MDFVKQYKLVVEARAVVFNLCDSISPNDYVKTVDHFGQGSIRSTQSHIINAYIHWIANFALNKSITYLKTDSVDSVAEMREKYAKVNAWIAEFIGTFAEMPNKTLTNTLGSRGQVSSTPLTLFTHMITHEFHHKGQLVSMARILGYKPPDTDIIRL